MTARGRLAQSYGCAVSKSAARTIITVVVCVPVLLTSAIGSGADNYLPSFEETGFRTSDGFSSPGAPVYVNRFGGNLVVRGEDASLPTVTEVALEFSRVHNSGGIYDPVEAFRQLRLRDSPLGVGWTSHYGVLRWASGDNPYIEDGSGAREIFYLHNELTALSLPVSGQQWISTSLSVLVATTPGATLHVYRPDGRRLTFTFAVSSTYVLSEIRDAAGNELTFEYEPSWHTQYPDHPMVREVRDDLGRALSFTYTAIGGKARLYRLYLKAGAQSKLLASYGYRQASGLVWLSSHSTPELRATTYTYHELAGSTQFGAMQGVQVVTGGQWTFDYAIKDFYVQAGTSSRVLAVETVSKGSDRWSYSYPTLAASVGTYTVSVTGPHGFSGRYSYYAYQNGVCANTLLWKVGEIVDLSESFNQTSRAETFTYTTPLKVSNQTRWTACGFHLPEVARVYQHTASQDGYALTTTYGNYDLLSPRTIERPGSVTEDLLYERSVAADRYWLGKTASMKQSVGGVLVSWTAYNNFRYHGHPQEVRRYRTSTTYVSTALTYFEAGAAGKLGAVKTASTGGDTLAYDYSYGVMRLIDKPIGPDISRSIAWDGTVQSETIDGATRTFSYDEDLRLRKIDSTLDADVVLTYSDRYTVMTQDDIRVRRDYDAWGRLWKITELVNGIDQITTFAYDAYDRQISQTTPANLTYTMTYDVEGRLRSRTSLVEKYGFSYMTAADGVEETQVLNNTITRRWRRDHLGRLTRGELNGYAVSHSYSGTTDTIAASGQTRTIAYDFLGNKTSERHPEYGNRTITYAYNSKGLLEKAVYPTYSFTYYYDSVDRVDYVTNAGGARVVDFDYHSIYGKTSWVGADGVETEVTSFDSQGRPKEIRVTIPRHLDRPVTHIAFELVPGTPAGDIGPDQTPWGRLPSPFVQGLAYRIPAGGAFDLSGLDQSRAWANAESAGTPRLKWDPVLGASSYDAEIAVDGATRSLTGIGGREVGVADFGYVPDPAKTYQLRVRARSSTGETGPWSGWRTLDDGFTETCSGRETGGIVATLSLDYDPQGRLSGIHHPATGRVQAIKYAQNGAGREIWADGQKLVGVTGYGDNGEIERFTIAAMDATDTWSVVLSHDALGRLESGTVISGGRTLYGISGIRYNDWGFVEYARRNDYIDAAFSYNYGARGELDNVTMSRGTSSDTIDYTYDANGNLLSHSGLTFGGWSVPARTFGTHDSFNHVSAYTYDSNGRRTSDGTYWYRYNDNLQRLSAVDRAGDGLRLAEFLYDGFGERVRAVEDDRVTYAYRNLDGRLLTRWVSEPDAASNCGERIFVEDFFYLEEFEIGSVVRDVDHAGNTLRQRWVHKLRDELGNPVAVFAAADLKATGLVADAYALYSPYGHEMTGSARVYEAAFGFAGLERAYPDSLSYADARYYDSTSARFLTPDPSFAFDPTNPLTYNLYAYAWNNPIHHVDRDGRSPISFIIKRAGIKAAKEFLQYQIKHRIKSQLGKLAKKEAAEILDDVDTLMSAFEDPWYMVAVELLPVVGDAVGAARLVKKIDDVWDGLKRIERKLEARLGAAEAGARELTVGVRGFASKASLEGHFAKHASEWGPGNITAVGYAKRAESLLRSPVAGDIAGFTSKEGWVFRYNMRTNEFATMKPDGTIETLFRPAKGEEYWADQVARYGR